MSSESETPSEEAPQSADENADSANAPRSVATTPPKSRVEKQTWVDKPGAGKKVYYGLIVVCALLALADLGYEKHTHYGFEGWFGFYGFYGFLGFVGLVLVAIQMRKVVMRDEDYYD